jgi:hypothetical protein
MRFLFFFLFCLLTNFYYDKLFHYLPVKNKSLWRQAAAFITPIPFYLIFLFSGINTIKEVCFIASIFFIILMVIASMYFHNQILSFKSASEPPEKEEEINQPEFFTIEQIYAYLEAGNTFDALMEGSYYFSDNRIFYKRFGGMGFYEITPERALENFSNYLRSEKWFKEEEEKRKYAQIKLKNLIQQEKDITN